MTEMWLASVKDALRRVPHDSLIDNVTQLSDPPNPTLHHKYDVFHVAEKEINRSVFTNNGSQAHFRRREWYYLHFHSNSEHNIRNSFVEEIGVS